MTDHDEHLESASHRFPIVRFTLTTVVQLALALGAFRLISPSVFTAEMQHPWGIALGTLLFGLPLSLFEYLYHRYLLHSSILPFVGSMHRAHREHHGLTYVKAPVRPGEPELMVPVDSEYPVEHVHQEESMMFPVYALAIFYGIFWVLIALPVKLIFPAAPAVSSIIFAVTFFYSGYELWHAILHLPYDRYWRPIMEGPRSGPIARRVYSFHLMHHWRPTANLAVVGLWGIALWDHLFRTHGRPSNLPLKGDEVNYKDAYLRKPLWPISTLDKWQPALYKWSRSVEQMMLRWSRAVWGMMRSH